MKLFFYNNIEYLIEDEIITAGFGELLFEFMCVDYGKIADAMYEIDDREKFIYNLFDIFIDNPYILFLMLNDLEKIFNENDFDYDSQGIFFSAFEMYKGKTKYLDENTKLKYLKINGHNIDKLHLYFINVDKINIELGEALQFCAGATYKNDDMSNVRIKRYANSRRFSIYNKINDMENGDYLKASLQNKLNRLKIYYNEIPQINSSYDIYFILDGDVDNLVKANASSKSLTQILSGSEFKLQSSNPQTYDTELIEVYEVDNLINILYLEIINIINNNLKTKICQNCHKLFIPKNINAEFCDRIVKHGRTCKDIGPAKRYQDKIAEDMVMQSYNRERTKRYMRNKRNPEKYSNEGLMNWLKYAEELKAKVRAGSMDFDEYEELLSKYS